MTTGLDPKVIINLLNQSTRQLDEATLSSLASARKNAVSRQQAHAPVFALNSGQWTHNLVPHSAQQWLITGLILGILIVMASFWQHGQDQQISDIDVAILTDDLPIEVFVD